MLKKALLSLAFTFSALTLVGCGETTVVNQPPDKVIKKEVIVQPTESKEKTTTIKENVDGSKTKTETKVETK